MAAKSTQKLLWAIVVLLTVIAVRPVFVSDLKASADSAKFDHVQVISPVFLFKGQQGLLLLDRRNGNVWFLGRDQGGTEIKYGEPVLITRIPLEKLDHGQ